MKITHRTLFLSLLPMLAPLAAPSAYGAEPETITNNLTDTKSDRVLGNAWQASGVIGTTVKNSGDESIGEIKDLAVDMKTGEILAVVISSGGFLGMADTLSSVPCSALRFDAPTKSFKTKLTKEQLQKAPQHKTTASPDYSDTATMAEMKAYRASIGGDATAADNTARNEVDATEELPTPINQGNSESDIATTKDIRAAIVGSDLSFNAKNIKIITKDGQVVLRGVVDSTAEHAAVKQLVTNHVNADKVSDSLTVK